MRDGRLLPSNGCSGPAAVDIGRLRLILLDTQWWLHVYIVRDEATRCATSVAGVTAGHLSADCDAAVAGCASHALYGGRARFNILTAGPTFAALLGDFSATTTLGAEVGYGYAPSAISGRNACAIDVGLPVSASFFQRVRVLSFFTPGVAWDAVRPAEGGWERAPFWAAD